MILRGRGIGDEVLAFPMPSLKQDDVPSMSLKYLHYCFNFLETRPIVESDKIEIVKPASRMPLTLFLLLFCLFHLCDFVVTPKTNSNADDELEEHAKDRFTIKGHKIVRAKSGDYYVFTLVYQYVGFD
jgi:hypothetical protein